MVNVVFGDLICQPGRKAEPGNNLIDSGNIGNPVPDVDYCRDTLGDELGFPRRYGIVDLRGGRAAAGIPGQKMVLGKAEILQKPDNGIGSGLGVVYQIDKGIRGNLEQTVQIGMVEGAHAYQLSDSFRNRTGETVFTSSEVYRIHSAPASFSGVTAARRTDSMSNREPKMELR